MSFWTQLQRIDRRYLYVAVAIVVLAPLVARSGRHPTVVFDEVERAFATIESVPPGKIVIVSTVWGPGTIAENGPQTEAIVRHLFRNRIPFLMISWDQEGAIWTYKIAERVQKECGREYGVDWAHSGYRPPPIFVVASGMAEDFQKVVGHDRFGKKLSELPSMRNVRNHKQVGAVVEITPSATVTSWMAYFTMPKRIPLVYCPTAVMATEAYPFLDSGQLAGMLNGVIGAAQYEKLLGMDDVRTDAAATSLALSYAHVFIILLIVLGNAGYLINRRRQTNGRS